MAMRSMKEILFIDSRVEFRRWFFEWFSRRLFLSRGKWSRIEFLFGCLVQLLLAKGLNCGRGFRLLEME